MAGLSVEQAAGENAQPLRTFIASVRRLIAGSCDRTRAQRNAVIVFLVRVASAGLLYLSQVILARWMGTHEYGIYVFVWTWVLVLGSISTLGMPVVMLRMVPEYLVKGQHALLRGLLRFGQITSIVASTVVAGAAVLVVLALGSKVQSHFVLPAILAFACVPAFTLSDMLDGIGRSRGWMSVGLLPPYVLRPTLLLAFMTGAYVLGWPVTAETAAVSAIIATWSTAILQLALVNKAFKAELGQGETTVTGRQWLMSATPLLIVTVSDTILQTSDVLVLSAYLSPAQVGMYFAAAKTMSLVMFVHYAVGSAIANRMSALRAHGDKPGLEALVNDAVRWTFWPSLLGAVIILALGKPLLWMFSPQFMDAYPVMFVLALGHLIRASVGPADTILSLLGEQKANALILVTSAAWSLTLSFILVPYLGIYGAAIATVTACLCAAGASYAVARHKLGLKLCVLHVGLPTRA
jgi:O-antigen/teichoic acid export membrane protein